MQGAALPHIIIVILTITVITPCWSEYRCDGSPKYFGSSRSSSNNRFAIKISGNPHLYVPQWKYSVTLQSTRPVREKFIGFSLHVESTSSPYDQLASVGSFNLYGDALTKFSEKCPHMVMQASNALRSEVNVFWTAPPAGSGCVTFRATVVEQKDVYFMHDGHLSKTLCEDIQENISDLTDSVKDCCACDEAKYEVTFEGLWSRHSHPVDFPTNGWMTRFSDVVGASHNGDYKFWEYGGNASIGLAELVENGNPKLIEDELKGASANIRTIIKAKGISYPNLTGKTFAMFRVDRKHHLISLLSMIIPSPDWIVGVSALELCLRNCSWAEYKVVNLKPWDVGTDSGTTYLSPDTPTNPRENIHRITSQYPADPTNPFFDPTGEEMKPLARLYITRQRLYEKSCSDDSAAEDDVGECALTEWGEWSSCTTTCGRAVKTRSRNYVNPEEKERCEGRSEAAELQETVPCEQEGCADENEDERDDNCLEPNWSEWSTCSVTCGIGVQTRATLPNRLQEDPKCSHVYNTEKVECYQGNCTEESSTGNNILGQEEAEALCLLPMDQGSCNGRVLRYYFDHLSASCRQFFYRGCQGNENNFVSKTECETACGNLKDPLKRPTDISPEPDSQIVEPDQESGGETVIGNCQVSEWTAWGPCSVTCGRGFKAKTRRVMVRPRNGGKCIKSLEKVKPCGRRLCGNEVYVEPEAGSVTISVESTEHPTENQQPPDGHVDCAMTRWSHWSPCSATCGVTSSQMRTRRVSIPPSDEGKPCGERVETRSCNLLPCKG